MNKVILMVYSLGSVVDIIWKDSQKITLLKLIVNQKDTAEELILINLRKESLMDGQPSSM